MILPWISEKIITSILPILQSSLFFVRTSTFRPFAVPFFKKRWFAAKARHPGKCARPMVNPYCKQFLSHRAMVKWYPCDTLW